ncbi:Arabinose operon regulatory protein [uncultured Clostridium sp.]|uniref:response regulator transcription factor n=1 Tax=uncultured Clostridium sp. TaxID=59620 RepID=UPI000820B1EB|nr:response regulator [uncultured Clostridium sp.]SCJ05524.1 Arabinose operon regulatory protein [uncultured Clostridium sp.]
MYKVLIVEDIAYIREGIIAILKENFDVTIIEACNGREALEKVWIEDIDFIITDIKMPVCDGIELISSIRKENKDIPIIIISGYGEFNYAQKAINMGINGYLLKPIEDKMFNKSIKKVIKLLEDKKRLQDNYNGLKDKLLEKNKVDMISRVIFNNEVIRDNNIKNELLNKKFSIALLNIGIEYDYENTFDYDDIELIKYGVRCIVGELKSNNLIYILESTLNINQLVIIFGAKNLEYMDSYRECKFIIDKIDELLKIKTHIGLSEVSNTLNNEIYKEAEDALQMRFFRSDRKIFRYSLNENYSEYKSIINKIKLIEKYIQKGDIKNIKIILEGLFEINSTNINPRKYIQAVINEVIDIIIKLYGYEMYNSLNTSIELNKVNNLSELINKIISTLQEIYKVKNVQVVDDIYIIKKVKEYIDNNYWEDITVKNLSVKFNVNYSYLSAAFTRDVGISIVAYITNKRIEHAKELLVTSRGDIATIAETVGYNDLQYFYRVFKKNTGKTPLAYRNITKKVQ